MINAESGWIRFAFYFTAAMTGFDLSIENYAGALFQFAMGMMVILSGTVRAETKKEENDE